MSMRFKKFQNKILVLMKDIDLTIDHILLHFIGSKAGLYVSFQIRLYISEQQSVQTFKSISSNFLLSMPFNKLPWQSSLSQLLLHISTFVFNTLYLKIWLRQIRNGFLHHTIVYT